MTLGRLILAWLLVAAVFLVAARSLGRWSRVTVLWRSLEAAVLTLFAALWFDSLGNGEWWLVFLLLGVLAGFPARLETAGTLRPARQLVVAGVRDTVRYIVAGGILAWRLG